MYSTVVFDLDGTISDPVDGIFNCVRRSLNELGFDVQLQKEDVQSFIGLPLERMYESVCPQSTGDLDELVRLHREFFVEYGYKQNAMYPGVEGALRGLRSAGCNLFVCTSKPEFYARLTLAHHGIEELFVDVKGGVNGGSKSESISSIISTVSEGGRAILIGDRAIDIESARASGIDSGAVTWGFGTLVELQLAEPNRWFRSAIEWLDLME